MRRELSSHDHLLKFFLSMFFLESIVGIVRRYKRQTLLSSLESWKIFCVHSKNSTSSGLRNNNDIISHLPVLPFTERLLNSVHLSTHFNFFSSLPPPKKGVLSILWGWNSHIENSLSLHYDIIHGYISGTSMSDISFLNYHPMFFSWPSILLQFQ